MLFFVVIAAAGNRAITSYECDIKILKLQIDSTGHNGIQNNCKLAIYRLYLIGYILQINIMGHNYKQFIHVNTRIALLNFEQSGRCVIPSHSG